MSKGNKRKSSNNNNTPYKLEEGKHDEDSYPLVANTQYQGLNKYIESLYTNNPGSSCFVMQNGSSLALHCPFRQNKPRIYKRFI